MGGMVVRGSRRWQSVCLLLFTAASASAAQSLSDLTGPWQLVIDDFLIDAKSNLARTYHAFDKYAGNPVMEADQPWEGPNVYLYGTVLPTEDHSGYRMWYHTLSTGQACYATSTDGIHWTKPALDIISYDGSTANNMYTTIGSLVSVMHTPFNADPNRRYTFFGYGTGGYMGAWSPDGIHWTGVPTNPLITGGDVAHAAWDYLNNRYIGYIKVGGYVNGLKRRSVGFSETTDFTSWPVPYLIMVPDAIDDRWVTAGTIQRTSFYGFCPFAYESMYIGFLWIFRATDADGYNDGTIYVEVVSSHDGVHWTREEGDRPAMLPLGPDGAWDDSMVFTSTHPIKEGNTLKLYYGGFDDTHMYPNNWHGKIGLATLRKDGFASLDAGAAEGTLTTRPLGGTNGPLHVNCNAAAGRLKVEVLDNAGQVVPGFGRDDCTALQSDTTDQIVTWTGGSDLPATSAPIRLRFILQNASLYSFNAGTGVRTAAPPVITQPPAAGTVLPGGNASFSVQAIVQAPATYQWQKNGANLTNGGHYSGTATSQLTVSQADCQDIESYRCVVTHTGGSTTSTSANLSLVTWAFTGIGKLSGATDSTVASLSSDGSVAAGTSGGKAVIWSAAQGLKSLGLPAGASTSAGVGVGIAQGQVVVAVDTNLTTNRAYRWNGNPTGSGSFVALSKAAGLYEWTVRGLGTDGTHLWIAGSTLNSGSASSRQACLYEQTEGLTRLIRPLPTYGHDHSDFHAVSNNGVCAGQYQYGGVAPSGGARNAMKFEGGSACLPYNSLFGAPSTSYEAVARSISGNSLVLGGNSHYSGGGSLFQPTLWNNSTTPTAIPFVSGGDSDNDGQVLALNSDGTLAGGYTRRGTTGTAEAFIWDATHGTRALRQVLTSDLGLDLTGWTLQQVTAISADGLTVAGVGLHNGLTEGWVVSPGQFRTPPRISAQPASQTIAPYTNAVFNTQATGTGSLTYRWQKEGMDLIGDERITGTSTSTLTVAGVRPADAGWYRCVIQAACGGTVSDEATLTVRQVHGDMDGDGDVDADDLGILKGCWSGPRVGVQPTPQCLKADLDQDGDADQSDFGRFQSCLTGPDSPSLPDCLQ